MSLRARAARKDSTQVSTTGKWELLYGHKVNVPNLQHPSTKHALRRSIWVAHNPWATCLTLAAVALVIRLTVMLFFYQGNLDPERDHWMFGHEQGRVARSIVLGDGFADPLFGSTGPTAYPAPVYPWVMAGVFKICGVYSKASAIVIVGLNCLFSALTVIPLYFYARRSFGEPTAFIAGVVWVIFPYSIYWTTMRIWDTWLSSLLISILFLLALKLAESDAVAPWAGFGLLWGLTGLLNPVALSVLPGLGLWMIYSLRRQGKRRLVPAAVAVLCLVAVMAPWIVRNYVIFHKLIPVRDSLGLELYVGNNGNDTHVYDLEAGPWKNNAEWQRFQQLGEVAYFAEKGRIAVAYIEEHPAWYAMESVRRFFNVWTDFWSLDRQVLAEDPYSPLVAALCTLLSTLTICGLWWAMRKDAFNTIPYLIVLLCYPLVYCFTHTADWYRRPIDPFFIAPAAYALWSLFARGRRQTHWEIVKRKTT